MYIGAKLVHTTYPMHGKTSEVAHTGHPLFKNIPSPFTAMRYHSLAVNEFDDTPLSAIAYTTDGTIMALAHKQYPCSGVQFHPESVGTENGLQLLKNWAEISR
jgi:anthranilate/para-aminobenzoate synthase component II